MLNDSPQFIASQYLTELRNSISSLTPNSVSFYSQQAVSLFFDYLKSHQQPLRESIEILCEINSLQDSTLSKIGLEALFPHLIEQLNDSFDPELTDIYDRLFAQVISFCRHLKDGHKLDSKLKDFGLLDESSILERKKYLSQNKKSFNPSLPLKNIFFLSRITIGADVAITSVLISHLMVIFPFAEIVIIGPSKLAQLYGGSYRIRIKPVEYIRSSNLLTRLHNWLSVEKAIKDETFSLNENEYYIFDPDSRLTQLGMFPLLPHHLENHNYFFFDSRSFFHPGIEKLGELASYWINNLSGTTVKSLPFINLPNQMKSIGVDLAKLLRSESNFSIFCVSFGVGGNLTKSLSARFEFELLLSLSQHHKLFFDCGSTEAEIERSNALLSSLESNGKSILKLDENTFFSSFPLDKHPLDIIAWQGGIGSFASLISASDRYIGYDSSGQHIAAALGIPSLTIFINSSSQTFFRRWQPYGSSKNRALQIASTTNLTDKDILKVILSNLDNFR